MKIQDLVDHLLPLSLSGKAKCRRKLSEAALLVPHGNCLDYWPFIYLLDAPTEVNIILWKWVWEQLSQG